RDHFRDAALLGEKLRAPADPLARHLREQLEPATASALETSRGSRALGDSSLEALVNDLNRVVTGGKAIYHPDRFQSVPLSAQTRALTTAQLQGKPLEILNRLLLEEAFPDAIAKVWDTLPGVYALLHTRPRTALCLSRRGIRSATFGLRVLQGLARHGVRSRFDYLSTVSGGGFIGSWLSSWIHHAGSPQEVFQALENQSALPTVPEPEPLQ